MISRFGHVQTRREAVRPSLFPSYTTMYDPSTIELALEMGLDPGDFSTGPHEPFADDSGVGFQTYPPRKIDDFQDDIGDYRSSYT